MSEKGFFAEWPEIGEYIVGQNLGSTSRQVSHFTRLFQLCVAIDYMSSHFDTPIYCLLHAV